LHFAKLPKESELVNVLESPELSPATGSSVAATERPQLIQYGWTEIGVDSPDFRGYVGQAELIGRGRLLVESDSPNPKKFEVVIDQVLRGDASRTGDQWELDYQGGLVGVAPGDEVLFPLRMGHDSPTLLSFCAASGLYRHTDELEAAIVRVLPNP
jgi:hypothetical protein